MAGERLQRGIRKTNPVPVPTAAPGVAVTLYQLTPGRHCILRKIWYQNEAGADTLLQLGTGIPPAAFAPALPAIYTVNGLSGFIGEEDCIGYEFYADIAMQSAVAGVTVTVEVEEVE